MNGVNAAERVVHVYTCNFILETYYHIALVYAIYT